MKGINVAYGRCAAIALVVAALSAAGCASSPLRMLGDRVNDVLLTSPTNRACGPYELAPLIPDCPLDSVCFTSACEVHNECYGTCGQSKTQCDNEFYQDMLLICTTRLLAGGMEFIQCQQSAFTYWSVVYFLGREAYDTTQTYAGCLPLDDFVDAGACCIPGPPPLCDDATTLIDCEMNDGVFIAGYTCDELADVLGGCPAPPNDDCDSPDTVCRGQGPDPDAGYCMTEIEVDLPERGCDVSSQNCFFGEICVPIDRPAYRCVVETDNRLATTDGPDVGGETCGEWGEETFQADIWFEYVASCSGTLVIHMCGGGQYDSMLAVYGAHESNPDEANVSCSCPFGDKTLLACDDDACGSFGGTVSAVTVEEVVEGSCYLIRVGGWSADGTAAGANRGVAELDITLVCE